MLFYIENDFFLLTDSLVEWKIILYTGKSVITGLIAIPKEGIVLTS